MRILATETRISFAIHLRAIHVGFAPENIAIIAGINEQKLSFCATAVHLCIVSLSKTTIHLSVGG